MGRCRTFALLGLFPMAMAVAARIIMRGRTGDQAAATTEILMVFFLQFYIVILALFYGTSVTAEEVENRTLSYLLTRPVPKPAIVLGKFAAYAALMFAMVAVGLGISFFILNAARMGTRPSTPPSSATWGSSGSASWPTRPSSRSSGRSSSGPSSWGSSSASAGRRSSSISPVRRRGSPSSTT